MLKILANLLGNVVGIFKGNFEANKKIRQIKTEGKINIEKARNEAEIKRIGVEITTDNSIDLETVRNMRSSYKDEFITFLFLFPFFIILNIVPFISCFQNNDWHHLSKYFQSSVAILSSFPSWYKYIIILILVSALGFRSLLRKVVELIIKKNS